jgi:hypothetical protein
MQASSSQSPWRALPWAAVLLCVISSASLAFSIVQPGVYFSGDGGLKALTVRRYASGHFRDALSLPGPDWAQRAWQSGLYPFDPPFVYGTPQPTLGFPPIFPLLSVLPYRAVGDAGLYVLPLVGLWMTLAGIAWLGARLALPPLASAAAVLLTGFCSPLLAYALTFWEHSLAVGCLTLGVALLGARGAVLPALGGLCAGLAGALRPELRLAVVLIAVALYLRPEPLAARRQLGLAAVGCTLALLLEAGVQLWLTGTPLGLHGRQLAGSDLSLTAALERAHELDVHLLMTFPVCVLGAGLWWDRQRQALWALLLACLAFVLLAPFGLPNSGGLQLGPRYLLGVIPFSALAAASFGLAVGRSALQRRLRAAGFVLLAAAGLAADLGLALPALASNYDTRMKGLYELLRERPERVLVVTHQYIAQELTSLMPERLVFRLQPESSRYPHPAASYPSLTRQRRALQQLLEASGTTEYLLLTPRDERLRELLDGHVVSELRPLSRSSRVEVFRARLFLRGSASELSRAAEH